jgi:Holliday junction resolvasome RuvABC DNA-binding subunit
VDASPDSAALRLEGAPFTYLHVREDVLQLYGFPTEEENASSWR